jgi:hypothetical protein
MAVLIACPECNKYLQLPDSLIGKKVQCPKCKDTFIAERPEGALESSDFDLDPDVPAKTEGGSTPSGAGRAAALQGAKPRIFISYRRSDNPYATHHLRDRLAEHFGAGSVFMDVDSIPVGVDFVEHLQGEVQKCSFFVAVIGEGWLGACFEEGPSKGERRLDDANDFVRIEIESALARRIPVIPVLVGRACMPRAHELPEPIQKLARMNGVEVRAGRGMEAQIKQLIHDIEKLGAAT